MKQNTISNLPKLKRSSYENIFNVYADENGRYYYNLLQTVVIPKDLPEGYFLEYNVRYGDTWPFISYKVYKNPNLWWLITDVNNILDATTIPEPGSTIKILKSESVTIILDQIATAKL
jgi:nucleoid-associated protein YgaU